MSGFEVAGIVFGVLPLFIEIGKAYSQHPAAFHKAASRSLRDDKLQAFYCEFWWETFELRQHIEMIVTELPGLTRGRKQEVIDSRDLESWDKSLDIAQALKDYFASWDDCITFQNVMGKVLELLARLIKDETVHLSRLDKVSSSIINFQRS
jgi:hypothetical protein